MEPGPAPAVRGRRVPGVQRHAVPRAGLRRFRSEPPRPATAAASVTGGAVPLSEARRLRARTAAAGASQDFGELLERRGLSRVLLLLFGGGLALNLTPCVYPVIPLTVSFFGGQSQGQRRRAFAARVRLRPRHGDDVLGARRRGRALGQALRRRRSSRPGCSGASRVVLVAARALDVRPLRHPDADRPDAESGRPHGRRRAPTPWDCSSASSRRPASVRSCSGCSPSSRPARTRLSDSSSSSSCRSASASPILFLAAFSGSARRACRAPGPGWRGSRRSSAGSCSRWPRTSCGRCCPAPLGSLAPPGGARRRRGSRCSLRERLRVGRCARAVAVLFLAAAVFFVPARARRRRAGLGARTTRPRSPRPGKPAVVDFSASWCLPCLELDEKTFSDPRVREALSRRGALQGRHDAGRRPETVGPGRQVRDPRACRPSSSSTPPARSARTCASSASKAPDEFLKRLEKAP